MSHGWEDASDDGPEDVPPVRTHSWEAPSDDAVEPEGDDESQESSADEAPPRPASDDPVENFVDELLTLYSESSISAKAFCVLCYFASKAGMAGRCKTYAKKPGSPSGHYQRFLDAALLLRGRAAQMYELPVVGVLDKERDVRRQYHMYVRPPHEVAMLMPKDDLESVLDKVDAAVRSRSLPATYFDHPVVRRSLSVGDPPPVPLGLYMDGVAYSNAPDTVLGVWLVNVVTGSRQVLALVRKSHVCDCSCRGWCTYHPLLAFLKWSLRCAADGRYPDRRHDGSQWRPSDQWRADRAGERFERNACLIQIRGDWMEYCERLAFPRWDNLMRPCFLCVSHGANMYGTTGCTGSHLPWRLNVADDYTVAAERAIVRVTVTAHNHRNIVRQLFFPKTKDSTGRHLRDDVAGTPLKKWDRLEPTEGHPDPASFDSRIDYPFVQTFWRGSRETLVTRLCPLWDADIGVTPEIVTVDLMHTLLLGPVLVFCKFAIWALIESHAYCDPGLPRTAALRESATQIRTALWRWYRANPRFTRLPSFNHKKLGSWDKRYFKTKAAEALGFVNFLESELLKFRHRLSEPSIAEAAGLLCKTYDLAKAVGWNPSVEEIDGVMRVWVSYVDTVSRLELETPKVHLMFHLIHGMARHGGAGHYAVFIDESLNLLLKRVLRNVHQQTFEASGLAKMELALSLRSSRARS